MDRLCGSSKTQPDFITCMGIMSKNSYVELLCKSNFSFLRGASDAREYVVRAAELEFGAVGITDVNGVYGLPRAFEICKQLEKVGRPIKLIAGAEIKIQNHVPIAFIAKNRSAYGELCKIITKAHAGKEKGNAY